MMTCPARLAMASSACHRCAAGRRLTTPLQNDTSLTGDARARSAHLSPVATGRRSTERPIGRCQALSAHGRCPHAPSGVGGQPGRQAASRGQRSRRSGTIGHKNRALHAPWSPERSVQTLCRGARPASTSGFTGASSPLEPRPSPFDGDALPGSSAVAKCPLRRALSGRRDSNPRPSPWQ
jgi:hypothetical protein